jgi:hypothetical protein
VQLRRIGLGAQHALVRHRRFGALGGRRDLRIGVEFTGDHLAKTSPTSAGGSVSTASTSALLSSSSSASSAAIGA